MLTVIIRPTKMHDGAIDPVKDGEFNEAGDANEGQWEISCCMVQLWWMLSSYPALVTVPLALLSPSRPLTTHADTENVLTPPH